jgi:hypothetical protein
MALTSFVGLAAGYSSESATIGAVAEIARDGPERNELFHCGVLQGAGVTKLESSPARERAALAITG